MRARKLLLSGLILSGLLIAGPVAASGEHPGKHPGPGPGASFQCTGPEKPASCPSGKK